MFGQLQKPLRPSLFGQIFDEQCKFMYRTCVQLTFTITFVGEPLEDKAEVTEIEKPKSPTTKNEEVKPVPAVSNTTINSVK